MAAWVSLGLLAIAGFRVPRPLRVVPLGDSITEGGYNMFDSYRPFLFHSLRRACGVPPEFIGSRRGMWDPAAGPLAMRVLKNVTWGQDHEGHFGWTTQQVLDGCPGPQQRGGQLPGCSGAAGRLSHWLPLYNGTIDGEPRLLV